MARELSLLFKYQLSESLIKMIKGLHRLATSIYIKKSSSKMNKSVKSINPKKSVIPTGYDMVKAHGG